MQEYTVEQGDSLWKIAKKKSTSVDTLAHLNGLKGRRIHMLRVGQKLKIPDAAQGDPDSLLTLLFRGLDFAIFTPEKIKVEHDGKTHVHTLMTDKTLPLSIHDHSLGLKIWVEGLDKQFVKAWECSLLPIGKWKVAIDSRKVRLKGNLLPEKGEAETTASAAGKQSAAKAQRARGNTVQQQTRVEDGQPLHVVATIYTSENLRLAPGNEKYRDLLTGAARKYSLTPQSLAALIDAEAVKDKEGTWDEKSNENDPGKAQGLAQFFQAGWTDVFNNSTSLLCQDCKTMSRSEWLSKRLEAKYAIDGAAAYAGTNLRSFAKQSGFQVESLLPEEKAKIAYLLHHEGVQGVSRLLVGVPTPYTSAEIAARLGKQVGTAKKTNQLIAQYGGDPVAAYKGWLFGYIDKLIDVRHFTVQDTQNFAVEPRRTADIIADVSGDEPIPTPQLRPQASAQSPELRTEASASATSAQAAPAEGNNSSWFDPLEICTLRTAHLSNKLAAEFGMTRNNHTRAHQGIDLAADPGTPIRAVANGTIYMAPATSGSSYAYGNTLVLEVGINDLPSDQADLFRQVNQGQATIGFFYAHLSAFRYPVKRDSQGSVVPVAVHAGDIIGETGCTGNAKGMDTVTKGAHLHFEVRRRATFKCAGLENRVDPLPFIKNCTNR